MTPVEQTKISRTLQLKKSARISVVRCEFAKPSSPVTAFAQPEFTMMARCVLERRCSRETNTGAATTRFCVKTAAATAGRSEKIIAKSSPDFLMPQRVVAARNPLGRNAGDLVLGFWVLGFGFGDVFNLIDP
jgi:hypothetical protein